MMTKNETSCDKFESIIE